MTLIDKYRALLAAGVIEADPAQAATVAKLDALARSLRQWRRKRNGFAALLSRPQSAPKGLYIHGAVGRGKTMLMDLFFETTTFRYKRRTHFHEFMAEVHERIATARKTAPGDPIPQVAEAIADKTALLCFDEMHVTDIADAMILGRLFKGLFEQQVVVVATSNVPPRDLYRNGLNRQLFVPFIDLLEQNMDVDELAAAKDFRHEKLAGKPLYFIPADARARTQMDRLWGELTGNSPGAPLVLEIKGRKLTVPMAAMGAARFAFADLCRQPLGTLDYLALAHKFHTVFIDDIPVLAAGEREVARRFVNLIDTLYDNRAGLVVSAAAEPDDLYPAGDVHFLFERTASRLIEMRSEAYLAARSERLAAPAAA
jgi:cell division protein ZapE